MNNTGTIKLLDNLNQVIKGKNEVLELVLIALFSRGHLLIEDVPGVGKTTLVKALAKSMDLSYKRIQFTPDIMPSDIIGISIYDKHRGSFSFKKGPIFSQIFLADEINRTSPKTQSSLLQAMEEGEISTEDSHFILEKPFMVLATQNPLEYGGTFPLPEAQLDRFLMKISLGYPDNKNEKEILKNYNTINNLSLIDSVLERQDIIEIQNHIDNLTVHEDVLEYIVNISHATRNYTDLELGASPRASIDLLKSSKSKAFLSGRDYVIPDDVKDMVYPVFSHRLILSSNARIDRKNLDTIIKDILSTISIPVVKDA